MPEAGWFFWESLIVVCIGLVLGSFATALSWRVPRGISWVVDKTGGGSAARSACPNCHKSLSFYDLIPVFSWVALRGKCRFCKAPIGLRYPVIEAMTMLGCLGIFYAWGLTVPALIVMATTPFLTALIVIDMDHMILPNQLVLIVGGLAVVFLAYMGFFGGFAPGYGRQIVAHIAGMAAFVAVAWLARWGVGKWLKKEAMGLGDVKFFAVSGLWLGVAYLPFFLLCSGLAGVFWGIFSRIVLKNPIFPFGPSLILSLYIGLILLGLGLMAEWP